MMLIPAWDDSLGMSPFLPYNTNKVGKLQAVFPYEAMR